MSFVQVIWETIFQSAGPYGVTFACGFIVGFGVVKGLKWYYRRRLRSPVDEAHKWLVMVCEPESLNPENLGNASHHAIQARDLVNVMINKLKRAWFTPPGECDRSDESLKDWFRFISSVRIALG